jgi:hypothetical protein
MKRSEIYKNRRKVGSIVYSRNPVDAQNNVSSVLTEENLKAVACSQLSTTQISQSIIDENKRPSGTSTETKTAGLLVSKDVPDDISDHRSFNSHSDDGNTNTKPPKMKSPKNGNPINCGGGQFYFLPPPPLMQAPQLFSSLDKYSDKTDNYEILPPPMRSPPPSPLPPPPPPSSSNSTNNPKTLSKKPSNVYVDTLPQVYNAHPVENYAFVNPLTSESNSSVKSGIGKLDESRMLMFADASVYKNNKLDLNTFDSKKHIAMGGHEGSVNINSEDSDIGDDRSLSPSRLKGTAGTIVKPKPISAASMAKSEDSKKYRYNREESEDDSSKKSISPSQLRGVDVKIIGVKHQNATSTSPKQEDLNSSVDTNARSLTPSQLSELDSKGISIIRAGSKTPPKSVPPPPANRPTTTIMPTSSHDMSRRSPPPPPTSPKPPSTDAVHTQAMIEILGGVKLKNNSQILEGDIMGQDLTDKKQSNSKLLST